MSGRKQLFIAYMLVAYEGDTVIGVFDTETKANIAIKYHNEKNNKDGHCGYSIDEVTMNVYDRDY